MKDFFISYNSKDKQWAEWIAWTLEDAGYEAVIQAWDFRAGGDFVMEMQKAATGTRKTIAVLSENYLRAEYTQPEWGIAFARDPQGSQRTLVPVRIAACKPGGLLATRIYVDLVGLSAEAASVKLIDALKDRGKPATAPAFPGAREQSFSDQALEPSPGRFPGMASSAIDVWQEKLNFLRAQEPLAVAADQKFALKKQIEEALQKIRELSSVEVRATAGMSLSQPTAPSGLKGTGRGFTLAKEERDLIDAACNAVAAMQFIEYVKSEVGDALLAGGKPFDGMRHLSALEELRQKGLLIARGDGTFSINVLKLGDLDHQHS